MGNVLKTYSQDFYARPTVTVARDLLGAILCRRQNGSILKAPIVEVEAYTADDPACHAFRGKTRRTEIMFGPPGNAYVYFIYGMYFCLNVVTEPAGTPGAVLVRAIGWQGCDGPGKLCRQWQITTRLNGSSLLDCQGELWISPGKKEPDAAIGVSARIGISKGEHLPWRFYIKNHQQVSGKGQSR